MEEHQKAFYKLMNAYMLDPMGSSTPFEQELYHKVLDDLEHQDNYLGVLVRHEGEFIGLANCFYAYSTFRGGRLLNIHDFIVLPEARGFGAGRYLMKSIKAIARKGNCCKITLEVREDNTVAKSLYLSEEFDELEPKYQFWQCIL